MIYLDTSALAMLVLDEPESGQLVAWLEEQEPVVWVSSAVARVELARAVGAAANPPRLTRVRDLIRGMALVPLGDDLLDDAGLLRYPLRSLDAIHLTSALRIRRDLGAFVGYDKRLLDAAATAGLPIASPGAS